ncbi:hypothetical protein YWH7199_05230 [Fusobacterium nucleatum YWH7199]|nr:hypothetical protein [Fusobacterium nucleatum YWH7199]
MISTSIFITFETISEYFLTSSKIKFKKFIASYPFLIIITYFINLIKIYSKNNKKQLKYDK